jgi:5-methylcytosine-specific restriction endonuclease McrA
MSTGRSTTVRDRDRRAIARTKPPCGICEQAIDYTIPSPDPMSFEVDHVIALNNGGTDTLDNKQASHRRCNREKWDRLAELGGPRVFVTSRRW